MRRARRSGRRRARRADRPGRPGRRPERRGVRLASRGRDWFCFEQPDRDGARARDARRVARLDRPAPTASPASPRRGARLAGEASPTRPTARRARASSPSAASPSPPTVAARRTGPASAPGGLVVPEVALARRGRDVRLTVTALAGPDDVPDELAAAWSARLAELRAAPLPLLDPAPAGRFRIASVAPPEHYEAAVARAVERIRAGELREDRARPRSRRPRAGAARRGGGLRRAARRVRAPASCSAPAAATPPSSPPRPSCSCGARAARLDRRAGRLHAPLRRPRGRRPPRRAAAALRQGPRGAGDRRPPDRARAAPAASGSRRPRSPRSSRSPTSSTSRRRSARSSAAPHSAVELAGAAAPDPRGRRGAARGRRAADPGASRAWTAAGTRARWAGRTRTRTASSASRCAARCCAARGAALRRGRRGARLRPRGRAGRDRGQARRAAPGPLGLACRLAHELHRRAVHAAAVFWISSYGTVTTSTPARRAARPRAGSPRPSARAAATGEHVEPPLLAGLGVRASRSPRAREALEEVERQARGVDQRGSGSTIAR